MEKKKRGNPAWYKGMPSPNPKGRRAGSVGLAKYAREQTRNGQEMIDFLLGIVRAEAHTNAAKRTQIQAADILLDRAFGKAPVVQADVGEEAFSPLADASDEDLDRIIAAGNKILGDN